MFGLCSLFCFVLFCFILVLLDLIADILFWFNTTGGCGSTIGPIISSTTGMRAIDMGCPQLSMHSIRETMGTSDFTNGLDLFKAFFKHFR